MTDITIPPEALEAAAEAEYYARFGVSAGPWKDAPDWIRNQCWHHAYAACLAMLRTWSGMHEARSDRLDCQIIILPLTQEQKP